MNEHILIRKALEGDIPALDGIIARMGGQKEAGYFARCLAERDVFIAATKGMAVGCVQLNWRPLYPLFRSLGLPEIQDLNVVPDFRNQGIGRLLVETCENAARAAGKKEIAIGVGLYHSYGPAQRLYAKMGYVPDGQGIAYDDIPVRPGEMRAIDDNLTLKMVKNLP